MPVPEPLSVEQAMALGSAGLSAMLCLMAMEQAGVRPENGEVVVTGASGGVGSIAVALLARHGYRVVASTGKTDEHDFFQRLGAQEIIDRSVLSVPQSRPLERERWAGAIDNVGGDTLAGLLRAMRRGGAIASLGNAGGIELHTTVLPFILRGVSILGIDSNLCPMERRLEAWSRLAQEMPLDLLDGLTRVEPLARVPELAEEILQGGVRGRVVISLE